MAIPVMIQPMSETLNIKRPVDVPKVLVNQFFKLINNIMAV